MSCPVLEFKRTTLNFILKVGFNQGVLWYKLKEFYGWDKTQGVLWDKTLCSDKRVFKICRRHTF